MKEDDFINISQHMQKIDMKDLLAHKELLRALVLRQLTVRYKQTSVGLGWMILQPLVMMVILATVFKAMPGLSPSGVPYSLFILSAYIPWLIFSRIIGEGTGCILSEQGLISRVFFPRIIIPLALVIIGACDFLILILFLLISYFLVTPEFISINLITLPIFILILLMGASGIVLWTSALNVRYRDFAIVVPFFLSILFFLSPIIYSSSFWPENLRNILSFNPMLVVIDGFRWALFGVNFGALNHELSSLLTIFVIFFSGLIFFKKCADDFADNL
ncbi:MULTISPECIES: ABC transporter permease [unclassified Polynucleobacter]|uniref:ABC transporter permease n=1 Tax=unclassified Polynucleobacter TaxID=2640945 RepID=UPI0008CA50B8|nr:MULTISPECIES: ABC transporter permease [unclassified Polynucleobacter]OHC09847.1 MAG: hypothetical protein A2X74_05305 [Polynucleobacter sp. GWA2_45_21]HBK42810.1 phosphate ABC transporter permease [Polynucleobacter sp.]